MHILKISKKSPSPAFNVEQVLFLVNGIIGVFNTLFGTGNVAISFYNNLIALKN